jgi:hypothetical protein
MRHKNYAASTRHFIALGFAVLIFAVCSCELTCPSGLMRRGSVCVREVSEDASVPPVSSATETANGGSPGGAAAEDLPPQGGAGIGGSGPPRAPIGLTLQ